MTVQAAKPGKERFDPRALPITLKIMLGMLVALAISGLIIDRLMWYVLREAQTTLVLNDLQALSRSQAFRVVDTLGQEMVALSNLGAGNVTQYRLLVHANLDATGVISDAVYQPDEVMAAQVISFRETHGEFASVAILDAKGRILAIDPVPVTLPKSLPGRWPWFMAAYNGGKGAVYLSNPQDDHLTGLTGIHIAIPIYRPVSGGAEIMGIVYGVWNMSNLSGLTQLGAEREGMILQSDGSVLVSASGGSDDMGPADLLAAQLSASQAGSFVLPDSSGEEWLYGFVHLSDLGLADRSVVDLGWVILTRQPLAVTESAVASLVGQLRLALVGGMALVTLIILLVARGAILAPLGKLTHAAAQIGSGDLQTPIPSLPADEIGRLASVLSNLVEQLVRRVEQLRAAVQVSQAATRTLDVNEMLTSAAQALYKQFNYSDVRIYLADSINKRVWLRAAAGVESERLLRQSYRLPINEDSLVGRAILLGEAQVGGGRERLRAAGLITERSELALPLRVSGRSLGALHVIAGRLGRFDPQDIDILRLIADQIGTSIENARLFEQSAANLAEIEALNRRLTRQVWEDRLGEEGVIRHTLDPEGLWPEPAVDVTSQQGEIKATVYTDTDGRSVLAAPLVLRGETVGMLAVTRPPGELWTSDEIVLIESIATRMAMIAESIRLVEESTERAIREQRINEISASLLQRAASVDGVLQNALNQLSNALGSDHVSLRIGPPPVDGDRQITSRSAEHRFLSGQPTNGAGDLEGTTRMEDEANTPGVNGGGSLSDGK